MKVGGENPDLVWRRTFKSYSATVAVFDESHPTNLVLASRDFTGLQESSATRIYDAPKLQFRIPQSSECSLFWSKFYISHLSISANFQFESNLRPIGDTVPQGHAPFVLATTIQSKLVVPE
jgi:hypothetical protein